MTFIRLLCIHSCKGRIRERLVALGLFYAAVVLDKKHAELGDSLKDECSESSHAPHSNEYSRASMICLP